jgi:diguanylate cyclase (GGDEF)-like protein
MTETRNRKRLSLAAKLNILTISLILVTSVGVNTFAIRSEMAKYFEELLNHGKTIAATAAKNCEFGIFTEDRLTLLRVVEGLASDDDVAYVAVLSGDRRPLVERAFRPASAMPESPFADAGSAGGGAYQDFVNAGDGRRYIEILFPVTSSTGSAVADPFFLEGPKESESNVIGYLRLGLTPDSLVRRIHRMLASAAIFTPLLVLVGSLLTVLLTRRITSPLQRLTAATQEIAEGRFEAPPVEIATNDEISDLANAFTEMRGRLRSYRNEVEERTAELTSTNEKLRAEVDARKAAEEQLLHDALHDALTGLPNRALFMDRLAHAMAIAHRRADYLFAVLFMDLDRFKVINDSLGHLVGDQILIAFGRRLSETLRPGDTVARLGGDEFVVLLEDIRGVGNAVAIAERVQVLLAEPFPVSGHDIFATASMGVAVTAAEYETPEQVLRDADTAMYQAKGQGKARCVVFEPGMHAHAVERLRMETDLRRAIERNEFAVYYQPILSLITGTVVGYEALARWQHPDRGLVYPADFIPVAEETGMIVAIDRLVLREACGQMRSWQAQFPDHSLNFMSVNLSNKQMSQPDLVEHVALVLTETGLAPECLKLEITENVVIGDPDAMASTLGRLRALGVQLYIDDFGTGYSSLSYLHRLPIDGLKIDRSFIRRMGERGENADIVKTIMTLAKDMHINVVAEGIETSSQLAHIRALACEYGQGYLFSRPVESRRARDFLQFTASGITSDTE